MHRFWQLLTGRGRIFAVFGLIVTVVGIVGDQRDIMRLGLLLLVLPILAAILVARTRLRLSCERTVEPAQVALGSPMRGRIVLGQQGRLPIGILMLEDAVPRELGNRPRFLIDRATLNWRREVEYPLLGRVRGRFRTGPLMVRTTDPFGLVRMDRQFVATSEVMVTPEIVPLPTLRAAGGAGSTGEAQPHRIGVVGADDALIREYRQGDDVRRVHWRSTARRDQLMVRREEQAWDPSASVLLDSRESAHAGRGMHNSIEWAISAAGSVATHFLDSGFSVEIFDAGGPLHISGALGQHSSASRQLVVERLTDLRPRTTRTLHYAVESANADRPGQLIVAILGRLTPADAEVLLRVRGSRARGLAIMLDVASFAGEEDDERQRDATDLAQKVLLDNQWRVVRADRTTTVGDAWTRLDELSRVA
ncbi:DUF58 domain-containing protein [Microlunatus parietis]|uniref:Uncharacterized protein (DUF58 family) n=1 Tax=Microlunatus parietis TaxID=682979 RepID=A0A7Y9IDH7_9ACTN|nr:DUF58 domain-containing protein [Microlunatus parietis]NYE74862.1 uncharacterized protein (DUF58 family) [Microlunatus parietis]